MPEMPHFQWLWGVVEARGTNKFDLFYFGFAEQVMKSL